MRYLICPACHEVVEVSDPKSVPGWEEEFFYEDEDPAFWEDFDCEYDYIAEIPVVRHSCGLEIVGMELEDLMVEVEDGGTVLGGYWELHRDEAQAVFPILGLGHLP